MTILYVKVFSKKLTDGQNDRQKDSDCKKSSCEKGELKTYFVMAVARMLMLLTPVGIEEWPVSPLTLNFKVK